MTRTTEYKSKHNKLNLSEITIMKKQLLENRKIKDRKTVIFLSLSILYLLFLGLLTFS